MADTDPRSDDTLAKALCDFIVSDDWDGSARGILASPAVRALLAVERMKGRAEPCLSCAGDNAVNDYERGRAEGLAAGDEQGAARVAAAVEAVCATRDTEIAAVNAEPDSLTGRHSTIRSFIFTDDLRTILRDSGGTDALAREKAAAGAQALRDAADDIELPSLDPGHFYPHGSSERINAEAAAEVWLRQRADRSAQEVADD